MKDNKLNFVKLLILIGLALAIIVSFLAGYSQRITSIIRERGEKQLEEAAEQTAVIIDNKFRSSISYITNIAALLSDCSDLDGQDAMTILNKSAKNAFLERLAVADTKGHAVANDGVKVNISDRDYFAQTMQGRTVISRILTSRFDQKQVFVICSPVWEKQKVKGCVFTTYQTNSLKELMNAAEFNGGQTILFENNGEYVLNPPILDSTDHSDKEMKVKYNNFYEYLRNIEFVNGDNQESLLYHLRSRDPGIFRFQDGRTYIASYVPLQTNDWYVITMVPNSVLLAESQMILKQTTIMALKIVTALAILILGVLWNAKRTNRVLVKYQGRLEKTADELKLSEERYMTALRLTKHVVFEYDFKNKTAYHDEKAQKIYNFQPVIQGIQVEELFGIGVHPEDITLLVEKYEEASPKDPTASCEARILILGGDYIWNRVNFTIIYDENQEPVRLVGLMENIDAEKNANDKAERDSLTSLYNKGSTQNRIKKLLEDRKGDELHAFIIMDVDNFKHVNDSLGHAAGDDLLIQLTGVLREFFRSDDVAGRIGGDEFIVYMKKVKSEEQVEERIARLLEHFESIAMDRYREKVTISIGIAFCPQHGNSFTDLYHHADRALYQSKGTGKNRYHIYEEEKGV